MKLRNVLLPTVLGSVFLIACGHGGGHMRALTPASQPHVTMITEQYDPAAIRAAIGRALADQNFSMEQDNPGAIVASYSKGARMLKLNIVYDQSRVTLNYVDSQGMGANVDANGQVMLDKKYSQIMSKLDSTLKDELARPARDAAAQARAQSEAQAAAERQARQDQIDTEERQRNYQLRMEHEKTRQANAQAVAAEMRAMQPPPVRVETQTVAPGADMHWTPGYWGYVGGRYQWTAGAWSYNYANAAPPQPVAENPGMAPSDNYFWVKGHYRWSGNGYTWISGHWDTVRQGYTFVPAFWENRDGRWVHVEGHWIARGGGGPVGFVQTTSYQAPPPPAAPDCRSVLMETHHSGTEMMFCDGVEPYCAAALLRRGHAATNLMFCKGVESQCAVSLLNAGQSPTQLMNCKR
jgi:hypothetical protein